ncbi:cyclophilin-like fold protein [Nocardiopsis sp. EMB25]|uniref:cyclophilin-like fold protein n=1 Tax=Nocardiopsis sp. EMB25 TaxID=2835867 RepID=UPI00228485D7|nr:cyclophilin-like fold protein [Nocardiopsis sp. EMB25]MCY9784970.1 cyclophilin-like fold protein [Nocardiopsis sp. EMB25]
MRIRISWAGGSVTATLDSTPTSEALWDALPIESSVNTWGDEVYFAVPVEAEREDDATDTVDPGTVCYWLAGSALALPFGPTPISVGPESRLASAANVLGRIDGDHRALAEVGDGDTVRVERDG